MVYPDGTAADLAVSAVAPCDENGTVIGAIANTADMTERKQIEQALRESEEALRFALEAGNMVAFRWTIATGEMRLSGSAAALPGMDTAMAATSFEQKRAAVHPDDRAAFQAAIDRALHTGRYESEYRQVRPDGSIWWAYDKGKVTYDETGRPKELFGVTADVTERKRAEEAQHQSRQHLQHVLDSLFAFVGVMTPDGTLIEANLAARQAASLQPEDVLGRPFEQTYWWAHSPEVQARLRRAIERAAQGEAVRYDEVVRLATDRFITIDFMLAPMRDAAGRVTHLVPSGIDITERERAESALRESEERLRLALEAAQAGMWFWDIADDRLVWTRRCKAIFGLPPDQEMSYPVFLGVLHPDDRDRVHQAVMRSLKDRSDYRAEMRTVWPDNSVHWALSMGRSYCDDQGLVSRMCGIAIDITERKQIETALREREEEYRATFEVAGVGKAQTDLATGRFLRVNRKLCELTGYSAEELLGMTFMDITHPEDRARDLASLRPLIAGEQSDYATEKRYIRNDGTTIWVHMTVTLINAANGRPAHTIAVIEDITARKEAEAALTATLAEKEMLLRQKEVLFREVNHRVKNSLQLVSSLLMLQSRHLKDEDARQQFAAAHNRVLTVAKVHQRLYQQTKTPDRIEFGQYLHDLCNDLISAAFADRKQIHVKVEADQHDMPTDQAVPLALIVNELLTNAFKYAFRDGAGGTIKVTFRVESDGRRRLTVTDDGAGLPDGFDPAKSSSLGMRLVSALVSQLSARLEVDHAAGGARFAVVLPAANP